MVAAVSYPYVGLVGQVIRAGHFAIAATALTLAIAGSDAVISAQLNIAATPPSIVLVGDSLTDASYSVSPWYWTNAAGLLKPIANIGVASETIANILTRIDNNYTAGGLAGLPETLGWVALRVGTNDARGTAMAGSHVTAYDSLITKILTYSQNLLLFPVPPLGGASVGGNANVPSYNAYLQGKASANPTRIKFIDDCSALKDGGGAALASMFSDGIHFTGLGTMTAGNTAAPLLASILLPYGYVSPLSVDSADKYPAQPQWFSNHVNAGTGGSLGSGFTGTLPSGWGVAGNGAGYSGVCSIVAADGGDSNTTPWMRVAPSSMGSIGSISITGGASGRTITAVDPGPLDVVMQMRFNAFDASKASFVQWMQDFVGGKMTPNLPLNMGGGVITNTVVLRHKMPRPTANAAAGATFYLYANTAGAFTGAMGSFDVRCFTVRG